MTRERFDQRRDEVTLCRDDGVANRRALLLIIDLLANLCDEKQAWFERKYPATREGKGER